ALAVALAGFDAFLAPAATASPGSPITGTIDQWISSVCDRSTLITRDVHGGELHKTDTEPHATKVIAICASRGAGINIDLYPSESSMNDDLAHLPAVPERPKDHWIVTYAASNTSGGTVLFRVLGISAQTEGEKQDQVQALSPLRQFGFDIRQSS